MEFPNTGKQCYIKDCQQLDFLPFVCEHCQIIFCKQHFHPVSHQCEKFVDNVKTVEERKISSFKCTHDSCKETSIIEMPCVECKKHFCLGHRYHGCLEIGEEVKTQKLKKWQIPKKQFAEAKAIVDQQISNNFKKTKNTSMAHKLQLMRTKGSATGPKNVPMDERCYFLVYSPIEISYRFMGNKRAVYVNMNWTVGKATDAIAEMFKVENKNNTFDTTKLQLFHHSNGERICYTMDTLLTDLIKMSLIIDGENLILEYTNESTVDPSLYK